jgi:16S rRNA (cytidine1402-2'-O)-methyltransferase
MGALSNKDYGPVLHAAQSAAGAQHYPQGSLYVVATPIGNLADITLRALHVLALADTVACEDTRHTQTLLRAYGIEKPAAQLLALHQHNEMQAAQEVAARLQQGQRVAYVSDAGTPGISDPGARLVAQLRDQGLRVIPLPGASSVSALLSAAGIDDTTAPGFVFAGFLPAKVAERAAALEILQAQARAVVLLEAPHRIGALAQALTVWGARAVTIGREITKQFEEIQTLPAAELATWLAADSNRLRGEFTLVLHPAANAVAAVQDDRVLALLLEHLPLKTAVQLASQISGESKNALYTRALALKGKPAL